MSMPNHLIRVRHGTSEGNFVREQFKSGKDGDLEFMLNQFRERPGSDWRLVPEGVEQAKAAGEWIVREVMEKYELPDLDLHRYLYSPHIRTTETAGHLDLPGAQWRKNNMLTERSWGQLENLTGDQEHEELYPENYRWMLQDPLHWTPPGGESIVQVANVKVQGVLDTLHRDHDEKGVDFAVLSTHGEWMWADLFRLHYMFSADWLTAKKDPSQKIHNCQVFHSTRLDPENGEQAPYLRWFRSVNPYRGEVEGRWRKISRPLLTNAQMIAMAQRVPRLDTHQ